MTTTDNKLQIILGMVHGTTTCTIRGLRILKSATECSRSNHVPTHKTLVSPLEQHRIANHSILVIFQITKVETPYCRNAYPVYPSMPYGTLPERPPKIPKILTTDTKRSTYKFFLVFRRYFRATYTQVLLNLVN